jgi:hypothetical protein
MYFIDGSKRAGLFENNVFKSNLKHISDLEMYRSKIDPNLLQEIEDNVNERGGKNNNEMPFTNNQNEILGKND